MKEFFDNLPQNHANGMAALNSSPFGLAGLFVAQGMQFGDALKQGAMIAHQQQQVNIQKQQAEMLQQKQLQEMQDQQKRQAVFAQIGQFMQENPGASPVEAAAMLFNSGVVEPQNITGLSNLFAPTIDKDQVITDKTTGTSYIVRREGGKIVGYDPIGDQEAMGGMTSPTADTLAGANAGGLAGVMGQNNGNANPAPMAAPQMQNAVPQRKDPTKENKYFNTPQGEKFAAEQSLRDFNAESKEQRKMVDAATEQAKISADAVASLDRMQELIPTFYQGTGAGIAHGVNKIFDKEAAANYESFTALANELVLQIAQTQKGAQSDNDMRVITSTKPSAENTDEGNLAIVANMKAAYERNIAYAQAMKAFVDAGGSVADFKNRWADYVRANPLFTKDKEGKVTINQENLNNWDMVLAPDFKEKIAAKKAENTGNVSGGNSVRNRLQGRL